MPNTSVTVVNSPDNRKRFNQYIGNREPLHSNPLAKLPLGCIRPLGWLRYQLDLMNTGMVGRLQELSAFLADDNGWFGTENDGWEEQPYWLRGFYNLGVLTDNERIKTESRRWIEKIIATQQPDGYFGAPYRKEVKGENGKVICDLWGHMVMLDALRSHWEATGDERVLNLAERFFRFCESLPEENFIPTADREFGDWKPFVQWTRAGDMLPHIYWLYNLRGGEWLLDLATRFYEHTQPPTGDFKDSDLPPRGRWLNHHVVHFTQRFRVPANYYLQKKDPKLIEETDYWYDMHMEAWGQPGGGFAADELLRPGKSDPKQAFETCGMTEFAKSFYILAQITGEAKYADRTEEIFFNNFPAAQTPDLKALHYLTAANQPQLDASENHDYCNKGKMIDYSPHRYRCCQHNVAMGWPWFVEHLWMAAPGDGLTAFMYAPCEVAAKVRNGKEVTIIEETEYPFDTNVCLTIKTNEPAEFPLYLRVPGWCEGFEVWVNNHKVEVDAKPRTYICIDREWNDEDKVEIIMPAMINVTIWQKFGGAVSISRGPLIYSAKIEEEWRREESGTADWPEWEVFPVSPWNYGLVVDKDNPASSFEIRKVRPVANQPFAIENAPIEISAKAKRIPNWRLIDETVTDLQPSPIKSDESIETITMIPMGCARLRMTCLPVIGEGSDAREWQNVSSHEEAMRIRLETAEKR